MMHKNTITFIVFALLSLNSLYAQEAVPAAGGEATGTGGKASYTIGQAIYTSQNGNNGSISQGIQHTYEISAVLGIDDTRIRLELNAYPNPTIDVLNLEIGNYDNRKLTYHLYNLQGKLIDSKNVIQNSASIPMETLPNATYFLKVSSNNQFLKTFKIVKK
ncbi:T9SS type A sorting domain-containing protein [Flammeovirgaceae bacterium SG7u.111]|nr:T9SS type A sorting domain-containing protein [Flammeovirgaceae bacterium SG7u.132]WPO35015.1 T9SS type A sorting domain-containing protein [Flammeovirgaceae bacterium SG7u.111]